MDNSAKPAFFPPLLPTPNNMYALGMIGGDCRMDSTGLSGRGAVGKGASAEKKGEIVIIRLDKRRGGERWRAAWVL